MKALYGEGLHPNAEKSAFLLDRGPAVAQEATRLGRPFPIHASENDFARRLRNAYAARNAAAGRDASARIGEADRATIRSAVATEMFAETYGRPPLDAREFSGFVARQSRPAKTAVAGFD